MTNPGSIAAHTAHNAHFAVGDPVRIATDDGLTVAYINRVWTNGRYITATTYDGRGGFVRDVTVAGQVVLID